MIISVLNTKGGVGKSTVAINLAAAWAAEGYDTLLIDTDEEGTSLSWFSMRKAQDAKLTVISLPEGNALKKSIKSLVEKHDVIVIDGAPQLRQLLIASAWISNLVIIPVKPSPNDIWKLEPMLNRLQEVREAKEESGRPGPAIYFLVNETVERTRISQEIGDTLKIFGLPVMETRFGSRVDYRDSLSQGLSALDYSNAKAMMEVYSLYSEIKAILGLDTDSKAKPELGDKKTKRITA
jgi:chromosome partitioning protein